MGAIIDFAMSKHPAVRGVHFQPISYFGRCELEGDTKITIPRMLKNIEDQSAGKLQAADFSGGGAESPYALSTRAIERRLTEVLKFCQNGRINPVATARKRGVLSRDSGEAHLQWKDLLY